MTTNFMKQYRYLCWTAMEAPIIHTGTWQSTDTRKSPMHATHELQDELVALQVPETMAQLQRDIPVVNLPWTEVHFRERVGGQPLNPPPSHTLWPWARFNSRFQDGEQGPFSHSYPERMWPRHANNCHQPYAYDQNGGAIPVDMHGVDDNGIRCVGNPGLRYRLGDLADLVDLLVREPLTRQAYLPIWFPEDTGTHHGERVPCTLGYHFMVRDNKLSCRYFMRSCDLIRHFPDDVYLAARLTQWIVQQLNDRWNTTNELFEHSYSVEPGQLRMYITSLHAFVGDKPLLMKIAQS